MYWYYFDSDIAIALLVIIFPFFIYKLYKSTFSFFQKIVIFCTYFYLFGVFWACFLPLWYSIETQYFYGFQFPIQYTPFNTIMKMFSVLTEYNSESVVPASEYIRFFMKQIGGNLVLLLPMWIALPYIKKINNWKEAVKISVLITLAIEILQLLMTVITGAISLIGVHFDAFYITYYKTFDVDDLLLNTIWFLIGYCIFLLLEKFSLQEKINNFYKKIW